MSLRRSATTLPPYLANPMLRAGHDVAIIDAWTLQLTNGEIIEEARKFKPDVVGISFYSDYVRVVYNLAALIKKRLNATVVVGGAHPSAMPEQVLKEYENIDCLIKGWREFSADHLLSWIAGAGRVEDVAGLYYRQNSAIRNNAVAQMPADPDHIPLPSRMLLQTEYDNLIYRNIFSRKRKMDVLLTSRNCPYKCGFCSHFSDSRYYPHSSARVLEEIEEMVKRGINAIEIMDDAFTISRKRAEAILDGIISRKYNLEFRIRSRVNHMDETLMTSNTEIVLYSYDPSSERNLPDS